MKKLFLFIGVFILLASGCVPQQRALFSKPDVTINEPLTKVDINDLVHRLEALEKRHKQFTLEDIKRLAAKAGATNFFGAITLTGGTSGALDDIDGDDLTNGDICYVVTSTDFYVYYLNATSGAGESSPDIISPDDNAGNKRWELIFLGDAEMADMAQLAVTDGNFIVGNNTTWVAESGNTARTSLGLGTGNSPTFVTNDLTGITDYNIPYMQPAGAGFGDSPLWTDGTDVELGADDSTKHFDVHSAGTIKMRDASDDTLVTIGPVADGTTILGIIGSLNPSGDVYIADDKKIYLGSDQDFSMEYDEDGNDSASFDGADINYNGYYAVGLQNIPDLASRGPSYWFDGVDDYVSLADDADLNPGTGDFSGVCNLKSTGNDGSYVYIFDSQEAGAVNDRVSFRCDDTVGYLKLTIGESSTTATVTANKTDITADNKNHIVAFTIDRDSATGLKLFVDGDEESYSSQDSPVAITGDINPGNAKTIGKAGLGSAYPVNGQISRTLLFNLALTAAEVQALSSGAEVPFKYVGASQTALYANAGAVDVVSEGNNVTNWTAGAGAISSSSTQARDGTYSAKWTGAGAADNISTPNTLSFIAGKTYEIKFSIYAVLTSSLSAFTINRQTGVTEVIATSQTVVNNEWTDFTFIYTPTVTSAVANLLFQMSGGGPVTGDYYIDALTLTQIGCVLDLNPSGISPTTWTDNSGNGLDGTVSGALATNMPVVKSVLGEAGAPGVLNLLTAETTVILNDELGRINFGAPLEASGTDAILYGAGIWAVAGDTFAAGVNDTDLVFATGLSAVASEKARLSSGGQFHVLGPVIQEYTITTDNTNGAATHTIAELLGGLIRRGTGNEITGAVVDVTDTAANIVAGIAGCAVGSGFEFSISNEDSTDVIQLDGGTDVTIAPNDPSTAIPALSTGRFLLVVTNATAASEAVSVHALGFTTH